VKDRICLSFWSNHKDRERSIALELGHYQAVSHPQDKWIYLADAYARLPDNNCSLAREIRQLIQDEFKAGKIPVSCMKVHHYRYGDVYERIEYEPARVSMMMKKVMGKHYDHENQDVNVNAASIQLRNK